MKWDRTSIKHFCEKFAIEIKHFSGKFVVGIKVELHI